MKILNQMKHLVLCLFLSAPAFAGQVIQSVQLTPQQQESALYDWNVSPYALNPDIPLSVPAFDTSLGVLDSVQVQLAYTPLWWVRAENESATPITPANAIGWLQGSQLTVNYRPSAQNPVNPYYCFSQNAPSSVAASGTRQYLGAFDGTTDFAGTSGFSTQYGGGYSVPVSLTATSAREMTWWSTPGTRTIYLSTRHLTDQWTAWPGHWTAQHKMTMNFGSSVIIKYNYH